MKTEFNPQRRRFLKVGIFGSAALTAAAGGLYLGRNRESCMDCSWLEQADRSVFAALIPVMLQDALPDEATARRQAVDDVIKGIDVTVSHFPPAVRAEIRQLLWLLEFPLSRSLLAGIWSSWDSVASKDIATLLSHWQHSRLDLRRVAYAALHDLITGAWYANPASWQRIHYPGPPSLA